jgi:hypothetical protein
LGVRSYVFVPCIVCKMSPREPYTIYLNTDDFLDGEGRGFGNRISIQTVAVIKAARALRKVYRVHEGRPVRAI